MTIQIAEHEQWETVLKIRPELNCDRIHFRSLIPTGFSFQVEAKGNKPTAPRRSMKARFLEYGTEPAGEQDNTDMRHCSVSKETNRRLQPFASGRAGPACRYGLLVCLVLKKGHKMALTIRIKDEGRIMSLLYISHCKQMHTKTRIDGSVERIYTRENKKNHYHYHYRQTEATLFPWIRLKKLRSHAKKHFMYLPSTPSSASSHSRHFFPLRIPRPEPQFLPSTHLSAAYTSFMNTNL